ncbi:MAG TPA: NUDIX domain-containing protein [Candidatus Nitrosocosmicus sp.]|nr:NUDIX domain-containing protein [Candidatus Nitrosocosmicus sp.]
MGHIHKIIDFVVEGFIVYNNSVLLVDHKKAKKILPVGGHIELDEDPEEALFREIEEESGLKKADLTMLSSKPFFNEKGIKSLFSPHYLNIHNISKEHKHICFVYFLKSNTNKVILAEKEHNFIKWYSEDDLNKTELLLNIRYYAKAAIHKARE